MIEASSGFADLVPVIAGLFAGHPFLPLLALLFGIEVTP